MSQPIRRKVISALLLVGVLLAFSVFALFFKASPINSFAILINRTRVTEFRKMEMTEFQSKPTSVELLKKVTELESKLASLESRVNVSEEGKKINDAELLQTLTEIQNNLASLESRVNVSEEAKKINDAKLLKKVTELQSKVDSLEARGWVSKGGKKTNVQKVTSLQNQVCTPASPKKIFRSQAGQDAIINDVIFQGATRKTFVEMGMMDGLQDSNSFFFENSLCWTGLCVEANSRWKKALHKNRPLCRNVIGGICDKDGLRTFVEVIGGTGWSGFEDTLGPNTEATARAWGFGIEKRKVMCHTMPSLLASHNVSHVDWWSLDVEGMELSVLKTVDFSNVSIDVISVEINGGGASTSPGPQRKQIYKLLTSKGYNRIFTMQISNGRCRFDLDDVYALPHVRYDLKKYPERFKLKAVPHC